MSFRIAPAGWRRWSLFAWAIVVAGSLAGCFSSKNPDEHCNDLSEYQASRSVPGLVTPDSLSAPNSSSGLVVPPAPDAPDNDATGTLAAAQPGAACLARPPDFFRKDPAPAAN